MPDPYQLQIAQTNYSLGFDEERGAYYARWSCPACGDAGISEKACTSEVEALAEARYRAQLHHAKKHPTKRAAKKPRRPR